ncbi:MAG: radical SAM family heme chaperone HemW [Phycisphaerae bacterium]|nr:radical SAM family heme chaperone HemW [Phycisphaerae bacterium]
MKNGVSLYVHVPFCEHKCAYCGFYSEPVDAHNVELLVDALLTELHRYELQDPIRTVYLGGGSPTCLGRQYLMQLVEALAAQAPEAEEFTVEANPGQVDADLLTALRRAGVNRLSIGAQSFIESEVRFLGRGHNVHDTKQAVHHARAAGFENISLDLIFAIPNSTMSSWKKSLAAALSHDVQHISAYALTLEGGTALQSAIAVGEIVSIDEETDRQMYDIGIETLAQAGYGQYEISNFAKPGFECRHNLRYWANEPFIGIGPSAASFYRGRRTTNIADVRAYVDGINAGTPMLVDAQVPGEIQVACETAVLNLRRMEGIDLEHFREQTGYDAAELFAGEIEEHRKAGLLKVADGHIRLTRQAFAIADRVLSDFSTV